MKVEIEQINNGYIVKYWDKKQTDEFTYVYKATDDLYMLSEIAFKFLRRKVKIEEK